MRKPGTTTINGGTALSPLTFNGAVTNGTVSSGVNYTGTFQATNSYVTFAGAMTNNAGSFFTVQNTTATFNGAVVNNGTWTTDPSTMIFDDGFTNNGTVSASNGDIYEFLGTGTQVLDLGNSNITAAGLVIGPNGLLGITGNGSLTFGNSTLTSGYYTEDSNDDIAPSATPIPGAAWLLLSGLAGVALIRKRLGR